MQYWPAAVFALAFAWSVWMVWRNLTRRTVRLRGREWSKQEAPIVYWISTLFHAAFAVLIIIGFLIRGLGGLTAS